MYRILVVDDEKNIRLGIKAILERQYPNYEVVVASDGKEALSFIDEKIFHILVTDIKMPGMDGITLIQKVKEKQPEPAFIILSGYDDFSFAKEAIKCKVMDYLLKPVKRQELFDAIDNAVEIMEKNERLDTEQLNEYRKSQLNYILLNPNISNEEITDLCSKMQLTHFFENYYVGILKYRKKQYKEQIILDQLQLIQLYFQKQNDSDWIYFTDSEKNLIIITKTKEVFAFLKEEASEENADYLAIGISDKTETIQAIKKGYEQAKTATKYKFLFPRCQLFDFEELKSKKRNDQMPLTKIKKIANMLGTDRDNELKALLLEILNYNEVALYQIKYIEELSTAINTNLFDAAFNQLGEESIEIFQLYAQVGDLYHFDNFHDYYYGVENLLIRLHHYIKEMKTVYTEEKYMEKAIRFIRENFHKDLNMAVVSNYISLNYSYFSHSFKEYTGKSFVDYLKKVRVEHAKKLLLDSENKIFEVSENVGFKNPKQFARVFRELEGISPKEFREKL